jgi:Phage DNA packaging protein, Nu1 subunit of terminase
MTYDDLDAEAMDLLGVTASGEISPGKISPGKNSPPEIPGTVTRAALRDLLGVSENRSRDLVARGVWVRLDKTRFDTRASIAGHVADLALQAKKGHTPELDVEKLRLAREQADKLALANARARGDMLDANAVAREWASVLRDVRAAILSTPSRIGSRLPHLTAHDVGEISQELVAVLQLLATGDYHYEKSA